MKIPVSNNDNNNKLRKLKRNMEHEGDGNTNCNWCTWNNPQRISKGSGRFGNKRKRLSISKISQNTGKSPGDLRRLAVTQPPVRNYQLTLM